MNDQKFITFNKPTYTGNEDYYVSQAIRSDKISGDGVFGKKCQEWFEKRFGCSKALLTPSCTHALEMAAMLINLQPGDEVIMPSYTFVSTANAFVIRGAKIVFVDIRPDTMNIDESLIEEAITPRTKAIVPVHYAGVACAMDEINALAAKYGLYVIEDAAQGVMANYKGKALGTLGHLAAYSFHETKNITSGGEGGMLIINDKKLLERAEIVREKGTNRSQFFRGMVDKYTWVDIGSSYLPSELQAAYLWGQLEVIDEITNNRLRSWENYMTAMSKLQSNGCVGLSSIPEYCSHNAHMFYIKCKNVDERTSLLLHLKNEKIFGAFHYVPLHTSPAGKKYSRFNKIDRYTTKESERLVRLPLWYGMSDDCIQQVVKSVEGFYMRNGRGGNE